MKRTHSATPLASIAVVVATLMAACGGGDGDAVDFDASTVDGTTPLALELRPSRAAIAAATAQAAGGESVVELASSMVNGEGARPARDSEETLVQGASDHLDFGGRGIAVPMDELGRTPALGATSAASATPTEEPLE